MKFPASDTYEFVVVCITDSGTRFEQTWSASYDNAVSAVMAYSGFVDHATCVLERVVTLVEPNGRSHTKVFKYPYGSEAEYAQAVVRFRTPKQPVG